ncbi:hypothetical protein NHH03_00905 [Stieleria sp. TO1_6]|nr:hypothetical protein [Stieleria tagensis]MCO8120275.1 hypothetical protein [Stieleria tagensis]
MRFSGGDQIQRQLRLAMNQCTNHPASLPDKASQAAEIRSNFIEIA